MSELPSQEEEMRRTTTIVRDVLSARRALRMGFEDQLQAGERAAPEWVSSVDEEAVEKEAEGV